MNGATEVAKILGKNPFMDANQSRIIELLREVHLLAFKEIERLNLRIAELQNVSQKVEVKFPKRKEAPSTGAQPDVQLPGRDMLNERQLAEYLKISVPTVRSWRLFRKGPAYHKFGSSVRYRISDVDQWVDSTREQLEGIV